MTTIDGDQESDGDGEARLASTATTATCFGSVHGALLTGGSRDGRAP